MDAKLLYKTFESIAREADWKIALDKMMAALRGEFIYDNVAVYIKDKKEKGVEVQYARAVGRGKTAEADVAWGEAIASEIFSKGEKILIEPSKMPSRANRLVEPYLLGFPMYIGNRLLGAMVFIRFGGPKFSSEHVKTAFLLSHWAASIYERKVLEDVRGEMESVQRQMRLQDDFVSTISHELRTPLGFIKGYSTSLLRDDTTWDESTQREFLTIIDEETDRLKDLIEDMLESARLQSKTTDFNFSPIRLDATIRDITSRVQTHKPDLKVALDILGAPLILGDSAHITRVFDNLFSNAMKYAPESPLNISIRETAGVITIKFADQGKGIPEEFLPFLFERFYRVPGERTVTGTGLGLYICKQIILSHHGKIWAESKPNKGTTFFIEFPAQPVE